MPRQIEHRSVGPLLKAVRTFLRGRKHKEALRYADTIVPRDQPPPNIPGGPYHRTSKIYYYTRDARREVQPPLEIPLGRQITDGLPFGFPPSRSISYPISLNPTAQLFQRCLEVEEIGKVTHCSPAVGEQGINDYPA